jgi:hypothetical protein
MIFITLLSRISKQNLRKPGNNRGNAAVGQTPVSRAKSTLERPDLTRGIVVSVCQPNPLLFSTRTDSASQNC